MSGIRIQLLKARALQFLENARLNVEKGYYDLAVFNCEQSLQLYLKAILQEPFASEFRSHELKSLLSHLSKLLGERVSGGTEGNRCVD
ncbi:HEPN domain protein [Metallosphaera sedula]|uniref:HEPN domain protein n=3 Tax=Metallosphaera TaxID=41980 RepID=A4YFG4_METS5|nr:MULTISPECIES: HEPN domain-containing protein [Metallosphaera]ABP95166.1 HEPN domain protein [Metallosphaera sedula DSM 5348]AIM27152.1 HEPN domain protein [Metallosphaera sedula]MCY0861380.1 HEPN domain-containing protein [Metallosphaera prunae]QCO29336.1 HEPN domain-containing protein [Metallosphaera prunae]WPX07191.1 HEPN domain-containing protein [Metallosphaera sedula DSM 5348]